MPQHDKVSEFLDRLLVGQQLAANTSVNVESEADPKVVGRTAYRLTGPVKALVAQRAGRILEEASDAGGRGRFIGPHRIDGGLYGALGETIIPIMAEAAE